MPIRKVRPRRDGLSALWRSVSVAAIPPQPTLGTPLSRSWRVGEFSPAHCQEVGRPHGTVMMMTTTPIASFSRSRLREPDVVATAGTGMVEIRVGSESESLALLPMRTIRAHDEVRQLAQTFVRAMVALRQTDPSPVLLGDVAYVADWSPDERERFLYGFAEAVAESLRLDDPAPARFYVEVLESRDAKFPSPQFTGEVTGDAADALVARVGLRT
jgi:hypothetical protein